MSVAVTGFLVVADDESEVLLDPESLAGVAVESVDAALPLPLEPELSELLFVAVVDDDFLSRESVL